MGGSSVEIGGDVGSVAVSQGITVSEGSVLSLGFDVEKLQGQTRENPTGGHTLSVSVSAGGNISVTDPGSSLVVGTTALLTLGNGSSATFENGGILRTQRTVRLERNASLTLEPTAGEPRFSERPRFELGKDAKLAFRNSDYSISGSSNSPLVFERLNANHRWHSVSFEGTDLEVRDVVFDGGRYGALVLQPGSVDFDNVTFLNNMEGLRVLSAAGTEVRNSLFDINEDVDNGLTTTGIRTGTPTTSGMGVLCRKCRSTLDVLDTEIRNQTGTGLHLTFANVDITGTQIRDNDGYGVYVSNSAVETFIGNQVVGNGTAWDASGTYIVNGGNLLVSPTANRGENRIANSATREVFIGGGGFAFLGNAATSSGFNAVFDNAGTFLANTSGTPISAENVYWGYSSGPPTGAVYTSDLQNAPVTVTSPLSCDPVQPFEPSDPSPCSATSRLRPADSDEAQRRVSGRLRSRVRALQATLADGAKPEEAVRLVYELGSYHRLDRTGMQAQHPATLRLLRALVRSTGGARQADIGSEASAKTDGEERTLADAALEVLVLDALTDERYDEAADLIEQGRPGVVSPPVARVLDVAEAALWAREGLFADAAARVDAVAATEPDAEAARGLMQLAEHYATRAEEAAEASGGGARLANQAPSVASTTSTPGDPVLWVYPNPTTRTATVSLSVGTATAARVMVYDVLGRTVARLHDGAASDRLRLTLDTAALPAGVYVVRAETDDTVLTRRLTVVR
ncbi:MAG: right-handed parallel beta-helix repeat-containing protein [Bacteroidota bacterium]